MPQKRILSGMRPTGKLHIGHYVGALENWIELQYKYQSFHLIADYHVLTTKTDTSSIYEDSIEMLLDWLAAGLDPAITPMFRQSQVKEHTELFMIFSMLISSARLERNPTLKEQVRDLNIENVIYGHLGYPVLQTADILLYKGEAVPVGEDQVPHVEISREIARRFNNVWGEVFPEPEPLLTRFSRLPGLDGQAKMSKSLNNTILLSEKAEDVSSKLRKAVTDPKKVRRNDPGRPEVCLVYTYHQKFNAGATEEIASGCRSGSLGCVDCKNRCASSLNEFLEPFRERRWKYENDMNLVKDILHDGEQKALQVAKDTMNEVHKAMNLG